MPCLQEAQTKSNPKYQFLTSFRSGVDPNFKGENTEPGPLYTSSHEQLKNEDPPLQVQDSDESNCDCEVA